MFFVTVIDSYVDSLLLVFMSKSLCTYTKDVRIGSPLFQHVVHGFLTCLRELSFAYSIISFALPMIVYARNVVACPIIFVNTFIASVYVLRAC